MSTPKAQLYDYAERLKTIPHEPGVYIMKDRRDKIVYIGKSINLRNRVRSYFSGQDKRPFVKHLPKLLGDIEIIITETDEAALQLEGRLIRHHLPRYNIAIKRQGVWLRLDLREDWPRIKVVRRPEQDGARYFGEYPSGGSVHRTTQLLERYFMLRTCEDGEFRNRVRPCMQHQIKRCLAPCVLPITKDTYREHVQNVIMFLEGRAPELRQRLEERMWIASESLDFEVAARLRDQIKAVDGSLNRYEITDEDRIPRDIVGMHREGDRVTFQVMAMREGHVRNTAAFHFTKQEFPDPEIMSSFLQQLYLAGRDIPQEILLPMDLEDAEVLGRVLSQDAGVPVKVLRPDNPEGTEIEAMRWRLMKTTARNVLYAFQKHHTRRDRVSDQLEMLQKQLGLWRLPKRMECFDISNLLDTAIVAGMVVLRNAEPSRRG